jgi:hypothetical protein
MNRARERRIEIIRTRLMNRSAPRIQLSLILLCTGMTGFLTSYLLLRLGMSSMSLRYPLSIVAAYCVFLLSLRVWLHLQRHSALELIPDIDPFDVDIGSDGGSFGGEQFGFGGGAEFAGGGAGGSVGDSVSTASSSTGSGRSLLDGLDLDLDEGWWIVLAIVAILGGIIATLYVIYIAPVLLAEILVDGVLLAGLYKRMKRVEQRHWLRSALRRTVIPALVVMIFLTVAGYALQRAVPGAHSVGDVWNHLMSPSNGRSSR